MPSHKWDLRCPAPQRLVLPVRIDPTGQSGPTRGQARGRGWRRTGHGWFVPVTAPDVPEQRILEASANLPSGGAVSGWAACRLHGAGFFDGFARDGATELPVPLVIGPRGGSRSNLGTELHRDRLEGTEVVVLHKAPCTPAERAVFDAARWAPDLREAVVALDMAVAARLTSIDQIHRYAATKAGWVGVQQVRDALRLASDRSRSPAESRLRLVWTLDAGLPLPLVNWPVADASGRFVAEVDLLDPTAGLVGEYDGADHRSGARHTRDVRREDALRRAGLEVVTITGRDLANPRMVKDRILAARERASQVPPGSRTFLIKVAPKPVQ